jgi:hypothetical protein
VPATEAAPNRGGQGRQKKRLPLLSEPEFRAHFSNLQFTVWENEETAGQRLLSALERDGLTDTIPLREVTPPGWSRNDKGRLVPLQL